MSTTAGQYMQVKPQKQPIYMDIQQARRRPQQQARLNQQARLKQQARKPAVPGFFGMLSKAATPLLTKVATAIGKPPQTPQQVQRRRAGQYQQARQQAQGSRKYMQQIVRLANEQGEPIKFTLKFKKFLGDLMAAAGTGLTGNSRAKSRIIFTVGGVNGLPAILEGRLVTRPYTGKQLPLAVSSDDTSDRRLIEYTIRPMNQQELADFNSKRKSTSFINY